jgi:hypothetical protein
MKIGSQSDLLTNGTMIAGIGFSPIEMRIGSSTERVSWHGAWRVPTICQFARQIVSISGRLAIVLMSIPAFRSLVCESRS